MDLNDFFDDFRQVIARRSAADGLVDVLALVGEVAERLSDDPVFGEFSLVDHQQVIGSSKYKIHGYTAFDEADGSIGLVVGKWFSDDSPQTLLSSDLKTLVAGLRNFASNAICNNLAASIYAANEAHDLANFLQQTAGRISRLRLHVITNGQLSSRYKEQMLDPIEGIPVEFHIWDLLRLHSINESGGEREEVVIELSDFGSKGIPCLPAAHGSEVESYLCVISGELLASLFDRYGSRLLEGNVRSFLGMKGGVNRGIRATIKSQPSRFFAYNNGIAATASDVKLGRDGQATFLTGLTNLQIVNGGQTTASVLSALKIDKCSLEGVSVPMKLTRVAQDIAVELIPKIAQYANTQNKVANADFFANHEVHRKLEGISRRLSTPTRPGVRLPGKWFYERSRGQYQNERLYKKTGEVERFDMEYPKSQLINKTDLAKFDSVWFGKPWLVAQGAQKNFLNFAKKFFSTSESMSEAEHWDKLSPAYGEAYYQDIISVAIIWKFTEKMISAARDGWYEGDYRAQIVAYTVAKLFDIYRSNGYVFDLSLIWRNQEVPKTLAYELEEVAKLVQSEILSPPAGKTNVGEWTKSEACWTRISKVGVPFSDTFKIFSVSKGERAAAQRDAKKAGELDDEISLQSDLFARVSSGYFSALRDWRDSAKVFTPGQNSLLRKASSDRTFAQMTPKELRDLRAVVVLAQEEGFLFGKKNDE